MKRFQDIKLNFNTGNNWFYSTKFRNELVSKLNSFKNNLIKIAKYKYPDSDVPELFNQFGELIKDLSHRFDMFKANEKKSKSKFEELIKSRQSYSNTLFMNVTVISNSLAHMSSGNENDLKNGGGGIIATHTSLALLKNDEDFNTARISWDDAFPRNISNDRQSGQSNLAVTYSFKI